MNPFSPISFLTCTVVIGNDNFSEYLKVSVSQMQTQKHSNSSYNLEIFSWFEVKADMNPFIPVSFLTCAMIIGNSNLSEYLKVSFFQIQTQKRIPLS